MNLKNLMLTFAALATMNLTAKAPKVVVVIVIDQFSSHYLTKLRPFLKGGLAILDQQGVSFTNAFYDHSMPGTGPGHTLLTTGTYGTFHGIVNNKWYNTDGKVVFCDEDDASRAAVFSPTGLYPYGRSARNTMVDNLSDQLIMHSYPQANNIVWAVSLKSRAAISMAGRLGKPIWFDEKSGNYTSSKAYFPALPAWVKAFNEKKKISQLKEVTWKPFFSLNSAAYQYKNADNYKYSSAPCSIIGKTIPIDAKEGFDETYSNTPRANGDLIECALACFNENYSSKTNDRFILWLSLSSLDKVGHTYGPHSKEALDMVYHMDHQIKRLMEYIYARVHKEEVLFVLTADHGIQPIPELLKDEGLDLAKRYIHKDLTKEINTLIEKKYGVAKIVQKFKEPQFYLNQKALAQIAPANQKKIFAEIKNYVLALPGIRRAWTFDELQKATFADYDLDKYLQRQLYKGRSGQIIYSVNPYTTIDTHPKGTSHITSFAYDTQVPLIFYQQGTFKNKKIAPNVYMPQVSVTLANLLDVPRPSAATGNILPGLIV